MSNEMVNIPSEVNYLKQLPSLGKDTKNTSIVISPSNGSVFGDGNGTTIQFDLPASAFLDPSTLYLRYKGTASQTTAAGAIAGTPAVTPFFKLEILFGSQVVETISNYNMIYNMMINTQLNVAQKVGAVNLGYINASSVNASDPTFVNVNSSVIPWTAGTVVTPAFYSFPLMCILASASHLIPLFAMPNVRIQLTLDSTLNMVAGSANNTTYTMTNLELCYDAVDFGYGVENYVKNFGQSAFIKSNSWSSISQTLPTGVSGTNELIYNFRFASIKSLFANFGGTDLSKLVNGSFDSVDITSNNGDYQFSIAGVMYPQRPISTSQNKYGALMELKMAIGALNSVQSNNMSITAQEFNYIASSTTTALAPGKFWIASNVEKLANSGNSYLLTGVSSQNSPISLRMNIGTATPQPFNVTMIVMYDALIEIDFNTKNAVVRQ